MKKKSEFPFERAKRVNPEETKLFREALSKQFCKTLRQRGRATKDEEGKYDPISIRLHPKVLAWAKEEAQKRGIVYQTAINEVLLEQIS
jgi:uncharacterized protein (DUF4415 family)